MPIQQQHYQITGMKQDNLVGTGFSNKFAHDIKNMRLNTIGDYTTGVWTTERGTKKLKPVLYTSDIYTERESEVLPINHFINRYFPTDGAAADLSGLLVLGQAIINDQWILFGKIKLEKVTPDEADCILRLFYNNNELRCEVLYFGNLNFNVEHPIETLPYFENDNIQKVYFTDGYNQPRLISVVNVKRRFEKTFDALSTQFDFIREVELNEEVTITKLQSGAGLFPPCTVKYAITYYDKYGQETNIVYDSPLYYPTKGDRGCSPDELSGDSFDIKVYNFDANFDYIRLYSIIRTSEDATPIVRIVADKFIKNSISYDESEDPYIQFTDTNTTGEIVDPTIIQYVGGRNITAQTLDQKTNTLFLGNITLTTKSASDILDIYTQEPSVVVNWTESSGSSYPWRKRRCFNIADSYPYQNQLNPYNVNIEPTYNNDYSSYGIKHFKKGEQYRLGLQFQDKYGVWSEVVHTDDMDTTNNKDLKIFHNDVTKYVIIDFPTPVISLGATDVNKLYDGGYRKVRMVCAKKNNTNRQILAQGVIDSTVYEQKTRGENGPYAMSSWFFRPKETMYNGLWEDNPPKPVGNISFGYDSYDMFSFRYTDTTDSTMAGDVNEFYDYSVEIQNIVGTIASSNKLPTWRVDRELLTFHSPELEFDDSIKTLDEVDYKLRVVGYIPIDNSVSSYYVSESFAPVCGTFGFTQKDFKINDSGSIKSHEVNHAISYMTNESAYPYGAILYPFQNSNMGANAGYDWKVYGSMLTSKMPMLSNTTYRTKINYLPDNFILKENTFWKNNSSNEITLDYFKIFEKNESSYLRLPITKNNVIWYDSNWNYHDDKTLSYLVYAGNLNTIAPTNQAGKYPIINSDSYTGTRDWSTIPVGLNYKSNTHGVVFIDEFSNDNSNNVWTSKSDQEEVPEMRPYLWLVNLERTVNNNEAARNEVFIPCGPAITLTRGSNISVYGLEGDHYFMRYDCLKTFPRSNNDRNQIVEILSFMVETRVNLDGRYDTNRGLTENTTITDSNFNQINKSYTQDNDFFAFTTLEKQSATLNQFSNQITYTSVKVPNEDVDAWTNITLAKTDDADGTCGAINKIININDKLFLFQEHGIAKINYDEKTTLTTDTGVPIELNSSGKYTGLDYVSREVGCQNKWSISSTKNGLLWVDDSRRELLAMDENMTSVTTLNGFDAFMIDNCNPTTSWIPDFRNNNFITYYDKLSKDLYFINNNTCLAWNEISKTFTSFYDYSKIDALATIDNHTLVFRYNNNSHDAPTSGIYALREEAKYSYFFDEYKPYWITLVCDGSSNENNNFSLDKVFDNIEYRADIFNMDEDIQTPDTRSLTVANSIFNKKATWNSYQVYKEFDINAERKFNTWRVQLPRATYTDSQGNLTTTRDRIRNPFCYIKLLNTNDTTGSNPRMILHDLAVSYSIK